MFSKWKILAFVGMGIMFGMLGLVGIFGSTTEVIQESEIKPRGYYSKTLDIPFKIGFSEKLSWFDEVIEASISPSNSNSLLEVTIKTLDGDIIWNSKFTGELKDSFVVVPGKAYVVTIMNLGNESITVDLSFVNAYFVDKEGNFVITKNAQYSLFIVAVVIGVSIFIIAQYKMHEIGEKW